MTAFELRRGNIELIVQVIWAILHINQASKSQAKLFHVDFIEMYDSALLWSLLLPYF